MTVFQGLFFVLIPGADRSGLQPPDQNGYQLRRLAEDVALLHDDGVARQLGGQGGLGPNGRRVHPILLLLGGLQSRPRVHRRLHLPLYEIPRLESDLEQRDVPQAHRGMGLRCWQFVTNRLINKFSFFENSFGVLLFCNF